MGNIFVFGYGSLMNAANLASRLPGKTISSRAMLQGYRRSFTKPGRHHLYLNLIPDSAMSVDGVLFSVTEEELDVLSSHEPGYSLTDITAKITGATLASDVKVLTYIAPAESSTTLRSISNRYLQKCLGGVPEEDRDRWLRETEILAGTTIDEAD